MAAGMIDQAFWGEAVVVVVGSGLEAAAVAEVVVRSAWAEAEVVAAVALATVLEADVSDGNGKGRRGGFPSRWCVAGAKPSSS